MYDRGVGSSVTFTFVLVAWSVMPNSSTLNVIILNKVIVNILIILIQFLAFVCERKKCNSVILRQTSVFLSPHVQCQLHPDRRLPRSSTYNICHHQDRQNTDNRPVRIKEENNSEEIVYFTFQMHF